MQDDYSKSADGCQDIPKDPFSVNAGKLLLKSQFPPSLCKTLDDVNQVLQNSSNQKLKQDISKHLSATGGNIELLDDLLPDILYKLYGLLELWRP